MTNRIKREDIQHIAPDMRRIGLIEKFLLPPFDPAPNKPTVDLCRALLPGKWLGRHTLCREKMIPRMDGGKMRILVIRPRESRPDGPGILWIHGGGYGTGVPEQDYAYIDTFCTLGNCTVVAPDYRLSYETPFPAALNDCYSALLWLKQNAESLGARANQLFVGGDSAGGGLTAAVTLYARDRGEVAVAYQMPFYPMLDDRMITPSSRNNRMPVWNSEFNERAWRAYLGPLYGSEHVPAYAAPSRATNYESLPPTCTFVGSVDPFCDETALYVKALQNAGVPVRFRVFQGCYHAFDMMAPLSVEAKQARAFYTACFMEALAGCFAENRR